MGPVSRSSIQVRTFSLPIDTFQSESLKNTCLEPYSPRICESVFQKCQSFLEIAKGNHRFESNLDNICNDLIEYGRKIFIG